MLAGTNLLLVRLALTLGVLLFFQTHEAASAIRAPVGTRTTPMRSNVAILVVGIATHFCALTIYGLTACVVISSSAVRALICILAAKGLFAVAIVAAGETALPSTCAGGREKGYRQSTHKFDRHRR